MVANPISRPAAEAGGMLTTMVCPCLCTCPAAEARRMPTVEVHCGPFPTFLGLLSSFSLGRPLTMGTSAIHASVLVFLSASVVTAFFFKLV